MVTVDGGSGSPTEMAPGSTDHRSERLFVCPDSWKDFKVLCGEWGLKIEDLTRGFILTDKSAASPREDLEELVSLNVAGDFTDQYPAIAANPASVQVGGFIFTRIAAMEKGIVKLLVAFGCEGVLFNLIYSGGELRVVFPDGKFEYPLSDFLGWIKPLRDSDDGCVIHLVDDQRIYTYRQLDEELEQARNAAEVVDRSWFSRTGRLGDFLRRLGLLS